MSTAGRHFSISCEVFDKLLIDISTGNLDPFLNKSLIIEGDVFLFSHRKHRHRAIPIMSMPARHTDRITFKEWLREVGNFRKGTLGCRNMILSCSTFSHQDQLSID
jgi:hypothetical protein